MPFHQLVIELGRDDLARAEDACGALLTLTGLLMKGDYTMLRRRQPYCLH